MLLGVDPVLLDAEKRTRQLQQATVNGEHDWLMICRPLRGMDKEVIECKSDQTIYIKQGK